MTLIFMKISLGMGLTIAGAIIALAGQVKVYFENQEKEQKTDELTLKISRQTKENATLLTKNKNLAKDLKKINQEQSKLQNDEAFFRNFDHSFVKKDFPEHSAYIFRQTKDGRVFSKSISTDSKLYESYDAQLIFEKNQTLLKIKNKSSRPNIGKIKVQITSSTILEPVNFGKDFIDDMQIIKSALTLMPDGSSTMGHIPGQKKEGICKYFKILDIDNAGITFAIGRAPCED
ncbi:hypothetical protein [Algibacter lectus]|uniref:hypothetical protein n=1 Tax=Algibacter lectus TaxID=221126 RepID=UPI0026ED0F8E|nr:hypothetical protein [Algibacter lectus]MDO7138893.1 hypothetical protein [Algibacter lectus]